MDLIFFKMLYRKLFGSPEKDCILKSQSSSECSIDLSSSGCWSWCIFACLFALLTRVNNGGTTVEQLF